MRGLDSQQEKRTSQIVRDTRSLTQRLGDFLGNAQCRHNNDVYFTHTLLVSCDY